MRKGHLCGRTLNKLGDDNDFIVALFQFSTTEDTWIKLGEL